MAKLDERMQLIGDAIISQAQSEAKEIIQKATAIRDKEIAECEDNIVRDMFDKVQKQSAALRQESIKNAAKSQMEAHRSLHLRRNELTEQVFSNTREKLLKYADTSDYRAALLKDAAALKDVYDHTASTVYVRKSDLPLAGEITAALGGGNVAVDASIKVGGFKLRNEKAKTLVDETLDGRLEAQRPWFLQNCLMKTM